MRLPTEAVSYAELDDFVLWHGNTWSDARPAVVASHHIAQNDASCEPVSPSREIDAWALRAATANGFGDAPDGGRPSSHALHRAARAYRAHMLATLLAGLVQAVMAGLRSARMRYRRHRDAVATYEALCTLDDRSLHDLGFTREEIRSVAAEIGGETERSRIHAAGAWYADAR